MQGAQAVPSNACTGCLAARSHQACLTWRNCWLSPLFLHVLGYLPTALVGCASCMLLCPGCDPAAARATPSPEPCVTRGRGLCHPAPTISSAVTVWSDDEWLKKFSGKTLEENAEEGGTEAPKQEAQEVGGMAGAVCALCVSRVWGIATSSWVLPAARSGSQEQVAALGSPCVPKKLTQVSDWPCSSP